MRIIVKNKQKNNIKKSARRELRIKKDFGAWALLLPSVIAVYFIIIRSQTLSVFWSFFNMQGFTPTEFVGLDNYKRVLTDTVFLKTFINTWKYVLWSILVGLLLPFITAIVMNELLHFRRLTRAIVYLPGIMPAVSVSLLWYFMYYPDASGMLNMFLNVFGIEPYAWLQDSKFTILYIIISTTWGGAGGAAIYYFAGLQGINRELYEAAMIDGAGFFRRHLAVTVPQMGGMLALFTARQCISVFNILDQPLQMTDGGPNNASTSLGLLSYRYAFVNYRPQFAMALSVIMLLTLVVLAVIYFKLDKKLEENQM